MRSRSRYPKLDDNKAMTRILNWTRLEMRMMSGFPKLEDKDESEEGRGCPKLDRNGQEVVRPGQG